MPKKSKFTGEQIAFALKQAELGVPLKKLCRKYGISEQTFYVWRKRYGSLMPSELKKLKQLEADASIVLWLETFKNERPDAIDHSIDLQTLSREPLKAYANSLR